jgi:hypothetical protein
MDTKEGSLESYLNEALAGLSQAQSSYEKVYSCLKAKERLTPEELILFRFFEFPYSNPVRMMEEATSLFSKAIKIYQGSPTESVGIGGEIKLNESKNLERKLTEAKGKVIDLTTTISSGGFEMWSATVLHETTYLIKVKEWFFRGNALHIVPEGTYCYITKNYSDSKLIRVDECEHRPDGQSCYSSGGGPNSLGSGHNCRGEIIIPNPLDKRIEILPPTEKIKCGSQWNKTEK